MHERRVVVTVCSAPYMDVGLCHIHPAIFVKRLWQARHGAGLWSKGNLLCIRGCTGQLSAPREWMLVMKKMTVTAVVTKAMPILAAETKAVNKPKRESGRTQAQCLSLGFVSSNF